MGILTSLYKWVCLKLKNSRQEPPNVEKVHIETPPREIYVDYFPKLEEIKNYFGRLYKIRVKGTESYCFCILHVNYPLGVYYGYTKYTGNANRNGMREVEFYNSDGSRLIALNREQWRKYEVIFGEDNLKWYGYSDGDSLNFHVTKGKIVEEDLRSFLKNVGNIINDLIFRNNVLKRVERLALPESEYVCQRKDSGKGYNYCYWEKFWLAGVKYYVTSPFVSFGYTKLEPENTFNKKAVAIYTDTGKKVGYISEKQLSVYYKKTKGEDKIPLVMESHIYKDILYGNVYIYNRNKQEYNDMVHWFIRLMDNMDE